MSTDHLVVVGGGVAGCTTALECANRGLKVTLIDEHPQAVSTMSLDAPYFYGSRLPAVLSDAAAMADRVLGSNASLMDCLEAGVDVLTNTCVWGNFVPGPNLQYTTERRLGLADTERSWLLAYDTLVLAPGARDLVLSFPGWQLPGVMGGEAAATLLGRYQTLGGSTAVVLGSGDHGLRLARQLIGAGIAVKAVVDVAPTVRGSAELKSELEAAGVEFCLSTVIDSAIGEQQVTAVRLRGVDQDLEVVPESVRIVECDTVCIAVGAVPNIELAAQTGCQLEFDGARRGWVPRLDADMRSTIPYIYVVGDGAGIYPDAVLHSTRAMEQARCAATAIADCRTSAKPLSESNDARTPREPRDWLRALVACSGLDVMVCQCEEVTRRELLAVQAPRYLGVAEKHRAGPVSAANRTSQDFVKRMTRAGMGHCQGKRCRDHAAMLLADANHFDLSQIVPGTFRIPLRPLPMSVVAGPDESEDITQHWPIWFQPLNEGEMG